MQHSPIDYLPLWGLFVVTTALTLLSIEAGFQSGLYRHRQPKHEHDAPVGSTVGASLLLVSFILAFTFGMAADRFQERRALVVEEAAAIEKVYMYSSLLQEATGTDIRTLLKEYVDITVEASLHPKNLKQGLARSELLQNTLWSQAVTLSKGATNPIMASLFIQSVSQMNDIRIKRLNWALRHRIPTSIWVMLYVMAVFGMALLGYQLGLSGSRSLMPAFLLALSFSIVILLVAILDSPPTAFSAVNQQAMLDLQIKIGGR